MSFRKDERKKHSNAYVIFTREPVPGETKTRLMPYYTAEQCAELHKCILRDIAEEMRGRCFDIVVAYTGGTPQFLRNTFGKSVRYIEQRGDGLGERMENAIHDVLDMGYEKVVLTGSDIPELEADTIETSFAMLSVSDVVIGPTSDGGYYLIGLKEPHHEVFDVKTYGVSTVFEQTVDSIRKTGLKIEIVDEYNDIDTKEDIAQLRRRIAENGWTVCTDTAHFINETLKISVIIPTYNEEKTVISMMEQLAAYASGNRGVEIIFADGGSTDSTISLLGNKFRVITGSKGRGIQLNEGALNSSGDVLFFLHCDSVLPSDFIEEIKRCMMHHAVGCFGIRFSSRNLFMLTNRIISNHRAAIRGIPFGDQGVFIDRTLFFELGMFPEIPLMEDYEFSLKLKRYGIRPGMTRKRILTSARRYGKGTGSILAAEYRMWNLRRLYRSGKSIEDLAEMYKDVR